jgi:hypothetical protein
MSAFGLVPETLAGLPSRFVVNDYSCTAPVAGVVLTVTL